MTWCDRLETVSTADGTPEGRQEWQRGWHDTDLTAPFPQPLDIRTTAVSTSQMSKLRFGGKAQALATNLMTSKNQSPVKVSLCWTPPPGLVALPSYLP